MSTLRRWSPSPYGWRESLGWLWRNATGADRRNPAGVNFLPRETKLHQVNETVRVAFVGDIMGLRGRRLRVAADLAERLRANDLLVANFEGTITDARRRAPWDQVHDPAIVEDLAAVMPPERTYLSVANNHAADFGEAAFVASVKRLAAAGFSVFGAADRPTVAARPDLRLTATTLWSNRGGDFIARFDSAAVPRPATGAAHVLVPHWGFELECYPRREVANLAAGALADFTAVVGHHPHTPQPVAATPAGRPVAYSLGDFCYWGPGFAHYAHGLLVEISFGRAADGRWVAGRVAWEFLASAPSEGNTLTVGLRPACPLFAATDY